MVYRFDDVVVDEHLGEVRVGTEHRPVEPQVFEVLLYLLAQRHRVVHKEELLDEVWGSRFISNSAVTSRIKSARQAIGDSGREQRLIRTVHGRGYRFVGDVLDESESGEIDTAPAPDDLTPAHPAGHDERPAAEPNPVTADGDWPLVARDDEIAAIGAHAVGTAVGGVLVTGAAGIGKSRLARALLERLAGDGHAVARINGHTEISTVPLAAFAHLLPSDVVDITGLPGDLARAALLQRARAAITDLAGDERLVLMVDDVERIDRLSSALLATLIESGAIFAVMTQRVERGADDIALEHLVSAGTIARVHLDVLAPDQLVALLTRVLGGPLHPETTTTLVEAAAGSPGLLRQLVDASITSGSLAVRHDLWTLEGDLVAPPDLAAAVQSRLDGLTDQHRDALELIAIAGDLDLDVAFALIDDEVLDELELAGMLAVRQVGPAARIRVSHPVFGELLREQLTPLRSRRHRARLADAIAASDSISPADLLRLVQLRVDTDGDVDDELLLRSMGLAILEGDLRLALRLGRRVRGGEYRARALHLRGEALYMLGRFEDAAQALTSIDLGELEPTAAADVTRRLGTYRFFGVWQHGRAIDELEDASTGFDGEARDLVESYLASIIAFDGRDAGRALAMADRLRHSDNAVARTEAHSAAALAHLVRGARRRALRELAEFRVLDAVTDPALTGTGARWTCMIEMLTQLQLGDPAAASAALARDFGPGNPPDIRFVAFAAGRVPLATADYRLVFDWLDPLIEIAETVGIRTQSTPLRATTALAALATGDVARAKVDADVLRAMLPTEPTLARFDLLWAIRQVDGTLVDRIAAIDALLDDAAQARAVGNAFAEELLLTAAVHLGGHRLAEPRLGELAARLDGPLIRLRHAAALVGDDTSRTTVARELAALGLHREAALVTAMPLRD